MKNIKTRPKLIGKKLGMARYFTKDGDAVPVTVIEIGENIITEVKTPEKHGYASVQIGSHEKKEKHLTKPQLGSLKKKNLPNLSLLGEFKINANEVSEYKVGEKLDLTKFLAENEKVDVTGTSIGKGFQGMVKLYHKSCGPRTHGSKSHRAPGSIAGGHTFPGRVFRGKKMPARMGGEQVTAKNLRVIEINKDENVILIRGAVPGVEGSVVTIKPVIKKWNN